MPYSISAQSIFLCVMLIISLILPVSTQSAEAATKRASTARVTQTAAPTSSCMPAVGPRLNVGSTGTDVLSLQRVLNSNVVTRIAQSGSGSPGNETDFFGLRTKLAVMRFQLQYRNEILVPSGLTVPTGSVGPMTRSVLSRICNNLAKGEVQGVTTTKKKRKSGGGGGSSSKSSNGSSTNQMGSTTPSLSVVTKPAATPVTFPVTTQKPPTTQPTSPKPTPPPAPVKPPVTSTPPTAPIPPTPPPTTSAPPQTTAKKLEWGASTGFGTSDLAAFESLVGAKVNIKGVFTSWNQPFPIYAVPGLAQANKTLLLFWEQEGISLDSIINGQHDAYIRQFAKDAKAYNGKVILAPFHEMNGNWSSWSGALNGNTPAKVATAWRHIYDVFGTDPDIKYAWVVNRISIPNTPQNAIATYYPGDAYVDYVGVDGFNFGGSEWRTFTDTFQAPLWSLSQFGKPLYIFSMASAEGPQKAAWIRDFGARLQEYPTLKGWVWFNQNKERDWRVNSDPASLDAFKALVRP